VIELLRDLDRETGWVLLVDGVEQSYVDVADPTHLEFEYMQHFAVVLDVACPRPAPVRAVHLGGGAMTMARWLAATRPGSRQVVVESSAATLEAVAPLGAVPGTEVRVADAALALETLPAGAADVVVWDLYDGPRAVTAALGADAVAGIRRLAAPGGVAVFNVSDAAPFDLVRPVVAGLRAAFAEVALLAEPSTLRGRRSGNCVLAAAVGALDVAALARSAAAAPVRARVVAGEDLTAFVGSALPPAPGLALPGPDQTRGRAFL
jgi:spermidine synthase